jgi:hypothetical protein
MVEQAIAGLATINTWTTASHTLTTADGTTDEARCAILQCSGAPGAAATVICPAFSKVYIIKNSVTGGYAVTLKTSAGTGISVPNGGTALLYCDGTNVVSGATYMATLSTTQVDILAQGDLRLQDTTGGEYVAIQAPTTLAASYTLTMPVDDGTAGQALITDGSGVLSWSTAASGDVYGPTSATDTAIATFDGVTGKLIKNNASVTIAANVITALGFLGPLNGTVGATTPAAGAFTTLSATGVTTLAAGTLGAPALTTSGDTNTGMFFPAADTIALVEGGVEVIRINSSSNVGIGTSSPGAKLAVVGTGYSPAITITDGATLNWDTSLGQVAQVTLGGNRTFAAPTNLVNGGFYSLLIIQDGTGSRTISWNAVFDFAGGTAPTLSTAAGSKDLITWRSDGTNMLEVGRSLGVA